jgi:hypothetical protein
MARREGGSETTKAKEREKERERERGGVAGFGGFVVCWRGAVVEGGRCEGACVPEPPPISPLPPPPPPPPLYLLFVLTANMHAPW